MADVVALELETGSAAFTQLLEDVFDILEGISENVIGKFFSTPLSAFPQTIAKPPNLI